MSDLKEISCAIISEKLEKCSEIIESMKNFYFKIALVLCLAFATNSIAQDNPKTNPLTLRGYVKGMPGIQFNNNFSEVDFSNVLHNRLNLRWDISEQLIFVAEGRNRFFYNELLKSFPTAKELFDADDGRVDMTWVWHHDGAWLGQTMLDRLYLDWSMDKWQVRVGRQRINWGITLVSNPNDLFNTYSFFDFDYPERPGADAIRIQHFLGDLSCIQLAFSPAKEFKESVGAMMLNFNRWNYDFQTLAGYYQNRLALGVGWAGHIKGAGLKGEATWFSDIDEVESRRRSNLVAAIGLDYIFSSGTFGLIEFLYNGGYGRVDEQVLLLTQPLRADNIMFSEYAITLSAQHPFSTIWSGSIAVMALPDIEAFFVSPSLKYSVIRNLDFELVGQVFIGSSNSIFGRGASALYASLMYSF